MVGFFGGSGIAFMMICNEAHHIFDNPRLGFTNDNRGKDCLDRAAKLVIS